uniref:Uncharacterized protein n=1 Tax=Glossina palpalis gambiensis TaxID=67801 RepID=A0A1B0B6E7_9MUSC
MVLSSDSVGPALVPFYRRFLPMLNAYKVKNSNCGDEIDYSQNNNLNVCDLIDETLLVLELHGGEDAVCSLPIVAKLDTGDFGEGFTHIFIDEVAACTETEAA